MAEIQDKIDKVERLACLYLTFLNNPRGLSFSRIKEMMPLAYQGEAETARRKFERDKVELSELGLDLHHYADGDVLPDGRIVKGHLYVPEDEIQKLPEIDLTPDEARSLAGVLLQAVHEYSKSDPETCELLESAAAKLLYRNPELRQFETAPDQNRFSIEPDEDENLLAILSQAHGALSKHRAVKIIYRGQSGPEERIIEGQGMVSHRGRWCFIAYCRKAEAIRSFYLDRIESIQTLDEKYSPRKDFNIRDYSLHPLTVHIHAEEPVRAVIDEKSRGSFEDFLGGLPPRKKLKPVRKNEIAFLTTNRSALFSWMIRNPGAVLRLGPEEMRRAFIEHLDAMRAAHKTK